MAKQNKLEDFRERRLKGNEKIFAEDFLPFKRYFSLDNKAYAEGAIPVKYKELMGLVGSMVLRCNDCITYHIDHSIDAGCTKEELNEAMNKLNSGVYYLIIQSNSMQSVFKLINK